MTTRYPTLRITPLPQFGYTDPVAKIQRGEKTTTLRKTRRKGIVELVVGGSRYKPNRIGVFVEFYESTQADPRRLSDEQWQADGIDGPDRKANGLALIKHFYKEVPEVMYLNKFRVVEVK